MNNVIEFKSRSNEVIEMKLIRFNQLKVKNFSGTLEEYEEKEFDNISKWLKVHIS
jgi:hypothetical protein